MCNSRNPIDCSPPGSSVHEVVQEHWSGLPFPSTGDLPNPRIEPGSPALQADLYQLSYKGNHYDSISQVHCLGRYIAPNFFDKKDQKRPYFLLTHSCITDFFFFFFTFGKLLGLKKCKIWYLEYAREGDGTPLQYPCLENPKAEESGRLQSMVSLRVGHN